MQNKAKEKKGILKGGNLNPFLVLMTMVVICTIVSYFVVPGAFDRETVDGVSRVVAGSYHSVERTPLSFFEMFLTVPNGLAASAAMMFAVMIIGGVAAAIINRVSPTDTVNMILDGMRGAMAGALIIGAARAVQIAMTDGGLIDPLVYGLSSLLNNASAYLTTVGMFIINTLVNFFIPSGSGQATAVMPIMIPLADMLDITRQTAVLAFQLGDGISNTFWPTNGTLLIYLGLSKVPLKSWYKFILPLQFIFLLAELVMLFVACQIGYGPMLQISAIAKQTRFPFIPPRFSILFSGD